MGLRLEQYTFRVGAQLGSGFEKWVIVLSAAIHSYDHRHGSDQVWVFKNGSTKSLAPHSATPPRRLRPLLGHPAFTVGLRLRLPLRVRLRVRLRLRLMVRLRFRLEFSHRLRDLLGSQRQGLSEECQ